MKNLFTFLIWFSAGIILGKLFGVNSAAFWIIGIGLVVLTSYSGWKK